MTSLPSPSLFSFCALCCLTFSHNFILCFFCCFFSTFPFRAHFCCDSLGSHKWAKKNFMTLRILSLCVDSSQFFFSFSIICIPTMTMARWNMRNYYDYVNCSFVSSCLSRLPFFTLGKLLCTKKAQKTHSGELRRLWNLNRRNQGGRQQQVDYETGEKEGKLKLTTSQRWFAKDSARSVDELEKEVATTLICAAAVLFLLCVLADAVRWRNFFH